MILMRLAIGSRHLPRRIDFLEESAVDTESYAQSTIARLDMNVARAIMHRTPEEPVHQS
jgi:hypothetical protein